LETYRDLQAVRFQTAPLTLRVVARANQEVAALLVEYADLLSITGGDAFKARAYEKAARAVAGHHEDIATLDEGGIRGIPNVGRSIAGKVAEILATGSFGSLEDLRRDVPPGVRRLSVIPGLGPKKAMLLYRQLGIANVDELVAAINAGTLRDLKGFGRRTEANLLAGVERMRQSGQRVPLDVALATAEEVVAALSSAGGCRRCTYAGSLRRGRETIGDIDILAASDQPRAMMRVFRELPQVLEVIASGDTKTSVRTYRGLQIDLRVVPLECWGAALQYFTGSKQHNVRVRELAVHKGLKLSEYGLFDAESGELLVADTEEAVYQRLGLAWVPPELREDAGEVAAAARDELPSLVSVDDLRGDLHTHTNLTDGVASVEDMVSGAVARGYEYYAVTDHAPDLVMQRMTLDKALQQRVELRDLQRDHPGMRLLHGTELNIAPDGSVDWPDEVLAEFDVCVASVHSHFRLSAAEQTRRIIRACENPHVHVIGHLTGRRLGRRDPIELDFDAVFAAAARTGTALEVNGGPQRLDLRDEHIRWARRHGVRFVIDSDAHSVPQLGYARYATLTARRGWLTAEEVVNTWPYERVEAFLTGGSR